MRHSKAVEARYTLGSSRRGPLLELTVQQESRIVKYEDLSAVIEVDLLQEISKDFILIYFE